jgi:glycosyltransferase involved in cell wall biosynthesis
LFAESAQDNPAVHIVHVIARLNDGGPARVVGSLCAEVAKRGHRTTVLTGAAAADERDLSDDLRAGGIDVRTIPRLGRRVHAFDDLLAFAHVVRNLRALRPDVVHTHTAKAGAIGRLACRLLRIPCLHTYHGHVLDGYFNSVGNCLARCAERLLAGSAHHQALTPTQFVELHHRYRIGRRGRWHIVPVPVAPVERSTPQWKAQLFPDRPVIGFLGRLAPVKDGHLFLDALVQINQRRPVQGLICGDGVDRRSLELRVESLAVPVLFTGFVPAGEAFGAMDVLLITSRNEGLPLVAVEAGWCAVPTAAPAVGGLKDLIRWGAVEPAERTAEALAQACLRLLDNQDLRRRRLERSRALVERLQPAALAAAYESLYNDVTNA